MAEEKIHYRDNPTLKKPGVQYEFTKEQIEEYIKCSQDPIYFVKNYMKIISLDKGITLFDMYPFQEKMIDTFHNNRFSICKIGRQSGKCLSYKSMTYVRNKKTGEVLEIPIGDFFEKSKNNT